MKRYAIVAVLIVFASGYSVGKWRAESRQASYQQAVNQVLGDTLIRERQLAANMQELENETQLQLDSISSDNDGLRIEIDRLRAGRKTAAAVASECTAERTTAGMFADLLAESVALARVYAAEADRNRIKLLSCVRAYDNAKQ